MQSEPLFELGNATLAMAGADAYSDAIDLQGLNTVEFQMVETGTPGTHVGTLYVQSTIDGTNWNNENMYDRSAGTKATSIAVSSGAGISSRFTVVTPARKIRVFWDYTSGTGTLPVCWTIKSASSSEVNLVIGDVEIGAVELKNAATDDRAKVAATASVAEGDIVLGVQAPVLGITTGAALDADGSGTLQQYQRGISKKLAGRKLGTTGQVVAIDATGARTALLAPGLWRISTTVECWLRQGASAVVSVKETALSVYLAGGAIELIPVTGASDGYVYFIAGNDPSVGVASVTLEE